MHTQPSQNLYGNLYGAASKKLSDARLADRNLVDFAVEINFQREDGGVKHSAAILAPA